MLFIELCNDNFGREGRRASRFEFPLWIGMPLVSLFGRGRQIRPSPTIPENMKDGQRNFDQRVTVYKIVTYL